MPSGTLSGEPVRRVLSSSATWTAMAHSLVTLRRDGACRRARGHRRTARVAHRHPRPQRVRLLLRDAADAGAAGRGARMAGDVRTVEPAAQDPGHGTGARHPQSAVLAGRDHPGARRPVRAARVSDAARGTAHVAARASRGGACGRGEAAAGDPDDRHPADDAAAPCGCRTELRLLPRQLRHSGASRNSRQLPRAADAHLPAARRIRSGRAVRGRRTLRIDRDDRRPRHRRAGRPALAARFPHGQRGGRAAGLRATALAAARGACAVGLSFLVLVLPFAALLLTSLVSAVGVRSTRRARRSRTTASCCSSMRRRAAPFATASACPPWRRSSSF